MKPTPIKILILFPVLTILVACKWFQPVTTTPPEENKTPPGNTTFHYWVHNPLHPANNNPVAFSTSIADTTGIQKVELFLYEYELYTDEDSLPSKKRRSGGQWGKIKTWALDNNPVSEVSYTYEKGFPASTQVEYIFKVTDSKDRISEKLAMFDAGTSPWPSDKILLYSTTREPLSQTFNLCFFPDVDFKQDWTEFLSDTRKLIFDGFHQSNIIKDREERWTFFYTQQEADGLNIALDFTNPVHYPPFMKSDIITGIDAFALLHKTPYSDGSYLYGNIHFLAQNVFTTESYNHGTAIHEMGHAVFQLSDEYNGCACFEPNEGFSNVYTDIKACQDFHTRQGNAGGECHSFPGYDGRIWYTPEKHVHFATKEDCVAYNKSIGHSDGTCITFIDVDGTRSYRAEPGVCIMTDDGDDKIYPFQSACMAVIDDYYSRFGDELLAANISAPANQSNIYGYEPIVYMELEEQKDKWTASVRNIAYGVPEKTNRKGNAAQVYFMDHSEQMTYHLQIDRPGEGHFCQGVFGGQTKTSKMANCVVAVPYSPNLQSLVIDPNFIKNADLTIKGAGIYRINLKEELDAAHQKFQAGQH